MNKGGFEKEEERKLKPATYEEIRNIVLDKKPEVRPTKPKQIKVGLKNDSKKKSYNFEFV